MKIKVVFLKDCKRGHRGDIKEVAPSLFNNVLTKQKLAVKYGTPEANNLLNKIKSQHQKHEKEISLFKEILNKLEKNILTIEKSLTPTGGFYDKIDEKEISETILKLYGFKIPYDKIKLSEKISKPGNYKFEISWHGIKKSLNLQAKGK